MADEQQNKFKVLIAPAEWPDGSLWFPDRIPKSKLDERRRQMSEYLFSCNYQQDPISKANRKFRDDWIRHYDRVPGGIDYFLTLDPAGDGTTKTTSHTAIVIVAVPYQQTPWYIVRAERWWSTDDELIEKIFEWDKFYNFQKIGVEMVQLRGLVRTAFASKAMQLNHDITYKLIELKTEGIPKPRRIEQLAPLFATGQILMPNDGMKDLMEEYQRFPKGRYMDLLDALAYVGKLINEPYRESEVDDGGDIQNKIRFLRRSAKNYSTGY